MLAGMSKVGRFRRRALLGVVATLALLGGCGTGGSTTTVNQFLFIAIGPEGGTATAGPVRVVIPPGALPQPTGVAILPQATPLPIASPDGCNYSYVGQIYCCGPVGTPLLVDGNLRMHYEEALIPLGFNESNLVLLEWDNAAQVMRPRPMPPVFQDTTNNFFEDPAYVGLGHVAIGLRDCSNRAVIFDLLVQDGGQNPQKAGTGSVEGRQAAPVAILWGVDSGGSALPQVVPTGGLDFDGFVPSPNLQRVLLAASDPATQNRKLHTVLVDGSGSPVEIASGDTATNTFLQTHDPMYGWLQQGGADHAYFVQYKGQSLATDAGTIEPLPRYEIWRRIGDGTALANRLHFSSAFLTFLDDIRQSDAGGQMMSYWVSYGIQESGGSGSHVDVSAVPAGTPLSIGVVPNSAGHQTPRFVPGSSDLYLVDTNGQEVNRDTDVGGFVDALFSIFAVSQPPYDRIVDFALAPDGDAFAAVVEIDDPKAESTESLLLMGKLSTGVLAAQELFQQVFVDELIWHPQGTGVFLDTSSDNAVLYRLNDDDGFYITGTWIPVASMRDLDVNRLDGRIAILIRSIPSDLANGEAPLAGVYVSPGDASDFEPVPTPGLSEPFLVRWLPTWRHSVGLFSPRVR